MARLLGLPEPVATEIVSAFRTRSIELCSGEHHPLVASYVRV